MTETTTITVPRIRDGDGQPTCCWWVHHCPFLTYTDHAVEVCSWLNVRLINLRDHGKGTTIPHANCPVWNGEVSK